MAQLWVLQDDQERPWAVVPLDGSADVHYLTGDPQQPVVSDTHDESRWPAYVIWHSGSGGQDKWMLFASGHQARVSVNGASLGIAMRCLTDKDEIHVGDSIMFFSTEQLARVSSFPGIGKPAKCPRCKLEIRPGTPAVKCPNCGVWHHQSEDSPCWTYAEKCAAFCDQPTSLEGSFRWVPEVL